MSKKIAVLGCGWLGLPVATKLTKQGYSVNGSTTTKNKLSILEENHINPFLIDLNIEFDEKTMTSFFADVNVLIVNIPPRMKTRAANNYTAKMKQIHQFLFKTDVKKVLFISSTSVYGDFEGDVTEETIPKPISISGKELIKSEEIFKNDASLQTTIIRFGGLIGPDRHPVYQLAKKDKVKNGNFPINLIHLTDCISIINLIIKNEYWGEIFNAVYPYHPIKSQYYSEKAKEKSLNSPIYLHNSHKIGKKVMPNTLLFVKNYDFIAPI